MDSVHGHKVQKSETTTVYPTYIQCHCSSCLFELSVTLRKCFNMSARAGHVRRGKVPVDLWCPSLRERRVTAEEVPSLMEPNAPLTYQMVEQTAWRYPKLIDSWVCLQTMLLNKFWLPSLKLSLLWESNVCCGSHVQSTRDHVPGMISVYQLQSDVRRLDKTIYHGLGNKSWAIRVMRISVLILF